MGLFLLILIIVPKIKNMMMEWHSCPTCGGSGVKEETCPICQGAGSVSTGSRNIYCENCYGKGVVTTTCEHCRGTGEIRTTANESWSIRHDF